MNYQDVNIEVTEKQKNRSIFDYISIVFAALCVLLPFFSWIKVPVASGLYSLFGMSDDATKFSLFGYIFAGNSYQDETMLIVTTVIAAIAALGIIFNFIYFIKSIKLKNKRYKYGTIGAIIMLIVSALFVIVAGILAAILQILKLTSVPYIMLIISIANIIIIKKAKKHNICQTVVK